MLLEDKIAVVTGASSGIGKAISLAMASHGAYVILLARRQDLLDQIICNIKANNGDGYSIYYDATFFDSSETVFTTIRDRYGFFDILVNCAGVAKQIPLRSCTPGVVNTIMTTNFLGAVELTRRLSPLVNRNGSIQFISSVTASLGAAGRSVYGASKAAIEAFSRSIAIEFSKKNIRVNCIAPGFVMTDLLESTFDQLSEKVQESIKDGHPLGIGKPEDIANASVFLASSLAEWITGTTLVVDGGYSIGK